MKYSVYTYEQVCSILDDSNIAGWRVHPILGIPLRLDGVEYVLLQSLIPADFGSTYILTDLGLVTRGDFRRFCKESQCFLRVR